MREQIAQKILHENKRVWEEIAEKFSHTRQYIWPELTSLINYVKDGDSVLDLGCGNGRLYELFKNKHVNYTGVDTSKNILKIAQKRFQVRDDNKGINFGPRFLVADALDLKTQLPSSENTFNVIMAIAVFHHIPGDILRIQFLKNCWSSLRSPGLLIITVWNLYSVKLLFKYHIWPMIFGRKLEGLDRKDVFIPFQMKNRDIKRYYHSFTLRELKKLVKKVGYIVCKSYYARGNIIIIVQKP